MIWTYTETHARTLWHRHAHAQTYWILAFTVRPPYTRSHSHIYTNTLYKSMCAPTPTHSLLNSLSLTRSHTHTVTVIHYYMSILWTSLHWTSPYTFSSGRFGRQTMRNDSKWKCTTCSPIRPLSSKPNICVFSLSAPGMKLRAQRKRLQPMKTSGNDSRPPKPGL